VQNASASAKGANTMCTMVCMEDSQTCTRAHSRNQRPALKQKPKGHDGIPSCPMLASQKATHGYTVQDEGQDDHRGCTLETLGILGGILETRSQLEHSQNQTSRHTKDLKTRCNPFDRRPLWHYGQTGFTLLSGPWCDYRSNCGSTILGSGSLVCHRPRVLPITMEGPALGHKGLQSHGPVFGLGQFPGIKFLQACIPRAS
jgi:hypothetical protein